MGDERLTYAELEERSNQLARLLKESGCKRGDRVCLFVPKNPAAIVAMLGTLKAGLRLRADRRGQPGPASA